jgi:hypothetical protein
MAFAPLGLTEHFSTVQHWASVGCLAPLWLLCSQQDQHPEGFCSLIYPRDRLHRRQMFSDCPVGESNFQSAHSLLSCDSHPAHPNYQRFQLQQFHSAFI